MSHRCVIPGIRRMTLTGNPFTPENTMPPKVQQAWRDLGLDESLVSSLNSLSLSRPTRVQAEAIPKILKSKADILIADQTGSGKTLAFLVPVIQALKNDEILNKTETKPNRPRELGEQTYSIAKEISFGVKLKVRFFGGGESTAKSDQKELDNGVDLIVITPGRVLQFLEKKWVFLKWVQHIIIDEADVLFEKDFKEDLEKILLPIQSRIANEKKTIEQKQTEEKKELAKLRNKLKEYESAKEIDHETIDALKSEIHDREKSQTPNWSYTSKSTQIIFAAATFSFQLQKILNHSFPNHRRVTISTLHKATEKVKHFFVPVNLDKQEKLQHLLLEDPKIRTMIFCNTLASCRSTGHFLSSIGLRVSNFHGAIPPQQRIEEFNAFKKGETNIIVCTDVASRGIDIPIDHVILFDFPVMISDFVHRSGRTARAGSYGKVTSLVQKRDRQLADKIKDRIEKGLPLEDPTEEESN